MERDNPKHATWNRARDCGDIRLPRKFQHPDDVKSRQGIIMERKRAAGWTEKVSPPGRVYQVISDTPHVPNSVGYTYDRPGSLSEKPAIVWNNSTGQYEPAYLGVTPAGNIRATAPALINSRKIIVGI